jgi:hypothetical protein
MIALPQAAEPLLMSFSIAFTEPTFQRALVLLVGAILSKDRRTISSMLWTVGDLADGDPTDYHRVFSRAPWCLWTLGKILATAVIKVAEVTRASEWIRIAIDCTVAEHKGRKVYGKGCHHDAVRSTKTHKAWRWGHRWVTLAVVVDLPFCSRPWALPILAGLYRPRKVNLAEGRPHKTPIQIAQGLMAVLLHWFPDKKFVFLGDGGYASHELARFCYQHGERAALVSKFSDDAGLYDPPPQKTKGRGRRRVKGRKRLSPGKVVEKKGLRPTVAKWYGVTDRDVELCDGCGNWYKSGQGLVPIHWVFIRDVTGTRRDEYYYTTHLDFTAEEIVSLYTTRWTIEITFQELRAHLGFETPRQRVKNSVLRMGPCLMGLFSVVTLIYYEHLKRHAVRTCDRPCYTKSEPTFTDAMVAVRRLFWEETIFAQPYFRKACQKLLPKMVEFIFDHLCQAA